jgi:predicted nucleic acid-binding protein
VILLDTSGLLAALDASQREHARAATSLAAARPPLLLSPFALAELTTSSPLELDRSRGPAR